MNASELFKEPQLVQIVLKLNILNILFKLQQKESLVILTTPFSLRVWGFTLMSEYFTCLPGAGSPRTGYWTLTFMIM